MHRLVSLAICLAAIAALDAAPCHAADFSPKPLVEGLKSPESVAVDVEGRIFISTIGEFDVDGDGAIMVVEDGKAVPFATGLDDPKGLVAYDGNLFVADKQHVLQIDKEGAVKRFAPANAFPTTPKFLNDLAVDAESGTLYVSDSGDLQGHDGAVYRITARGLVDMVVDQKTFPVLNTPNGLLLDGASHLLLADFGTGALYRIKLADRSVEKVAEGFDGADGLVWDRYGRLYISSWKEGKVFVIGRPGDEPQLLSKDFKAAADICLDPTSKMILVPDMTAGTLTALRATVPDAEVDDAPLPIKAEVAFGDLQWTGWKGGVTDEGETIPLRPIVLTHAGDGSNRVIVATQQGVIHTFQPKAKKTDIFLDLTDRVRYKDKTNEEGLLGLAFHPKFKENGELFVFYTLQKAEAPHTNVLSRFRVRSDNPKQADPKSEEVLLRIEHPFWNHDGGTVCFGPDGYLYLTLGDGGFGNDLYGNGQDLGTLLGKILRLDVDHKDGDLPYAIPKDNPFVDQEGTRPEIWACGFRNVWRFCFDHKSGDCWAADVGQNLWEEINLVSAGGNYGWNLREGRHPFGARGVGLRKDLIDPIWEYHHDTGKSITGGHVYRGKQLPELSGAYLYADYITGLVWALQYDDKQQRVVANRPIPGPKTPVLSFGEDEQGEVYFLIASATGEGIQRFVKTSAAKPKK